MTLSFCLAAVSNTGKFAQIYQVIALNDPKCIPIYVLQGAAAPNFNLFHSTARCFSNVELESILRSALNKQKTTLNTLMSKVPHLFYYSP